MDGNRPTVDEGGCCGADELEDDVENDDKTFFAALEVEALVFLLSIIELERLRSIRRREWPRTMGRVVG